MHVEIGLGSSAACTTIVHCERTADLFEDGTRAVQTRGARHGSVGSPGFYAVCQPHAPPMRNRCEDGMTCARTS
jgi:hypothetical protein